MASYIDINQCGGSTSQGSTDHTNDLYRFVKESIANKFANMTPLLTSKCCIYRVPRKLLMINKAAYTPHVISIGPFHRKRDELQMMEKHKVRYLHQFLQRSQMDLDILIANIKDREESVRQCYAESIELSSHEFVEMILLDGIFIIEYFRRRFCPGLKDENDRFLYQANLRHDIFYDLKLLENQLPFFILEALHDLALPYTNPYDDQSQCSSFLMTSCRFFFYYNKQKIIPQAQVLHFTDLIRTFYLPSLTALRCTRKKNESRHISFNATQLHEAGVTFKVSPNQCLLDIEFSPDNGLLHIPHLEISDGTESLFRNMMALEQFLYENERYICDYIVLMDELIDTGEDVELLIRKGIVSNLLGDRDSLATLFNKLGLEIIHYHDRSHFYRLSQDLMKYYENPWHNRTTGRHP